MSWLSTPGFFTRWMTERAIKHKAEKEGNDLIANAHLAHWMASTSVFDNDRAIVVRIVFIEGEDPHEGILVGVSQNPAEVAILTLSGLVVRASLPDVHFYSFDWGSGPITQSVIANKDLEEFRLLAADIVDRRPALIERIFTGPDPDEFPNLPHFARDHNFREAVIYPCRNVYLLGYNAQAKMGLDGLKELKDKVRSEEVVGLERWFNSGSAMRKPITAGCYIKFGNELVGFGDRGQEWLVVETFDRPISDGNRLVDLLAFNLEEKCFQSLLSYNFHITGCVVSEHAMYVEES